MNQKGYSWPETILTLAVLVVIFGTLLPLATKMTGMLHEKKLAMYAAETAYHGTILYRTSDLLSGERRIDGTDFNWEMNGREICVTYKSAGEVTTKCVNL